MRYHKQQLSTTQAPLVYVLYSFTDKMRNVTKGSIVYAVQTVESKCRIPVCIEHTKPSFVMHHFHSIFLQNNKSKHIVGLQFLLKIQCMNWTFNAQNMHSQVELYNLKELMICFLLSFLYLNMYRIGYICIVGLWPNYDPLQSSMWL